MAGVNRACRNMEPKMTDFSKLKSQAEIERQERQDRRRQFIEDILAVAALFGMAVAGLYILHGVGL